MLLQRLIVSVRSRILRRPPLRLLYWE
jgi:hypothetical protein